MVDRLKKMRIIARHQLDDNYLSSDDLSGNSSVVEHNLAKVGVESSNLFSRSKYGLKKH